MGDGGTKVNEAKIDVERIKEEWLLGNAVLAFVGALLMAQAWQPSDSPNEIFNLVVPTLPQLVVLAIVAVLATLSIVFALGSAIPPIRSWAIAQANSYSSFLEWLMWFMFGISLLSGLSEIPADQWWTEVLKLVGVALLLFLTFRMILRPLIAPAKWLVHLLFMILRWAWKRFVALRRNPDGGRDIDEGD